MYEFDQNSFSIRFLEDFDDIKSKVIWEKSRGGRFLWYKNWDLGWIWAGGITTEENTFGPIMSNFWGRFFKFKWSKKLKNIVAL